MEPQKEHSIKLTEVRLWETRTNFYNQYGKAIAVNLFPTAGLPDVVLWEGRAYVQIDDRKEYVLATMASALPPNVTVTSMMVGRSHTEPLQPLKDKLRPHSNPIGTQEGMGDRDA